MGNPVVHFEIMGKDEKTLQHFYQRAFGWEIGPPMQPAGGDGPTYALAFPQGMTQTNGTAGINGGIGGGLPKDYDGHVTVYVEVPNLEAALETIHGLGGRTMMPPDQVPNGPRIALFQDPEGHVVGLMQTASRPS